MCAKFLQEQYLKDEERIKRKSVRLAYRQAGATMVTVVQKSGSCTASCGKKSQNFLYE